MTKVRQTFQISVTDVNCACAVFILFELSLKLTPPPLHVYNISNGPYGECVVEVIGKLVGWLFRIRLSGGRRDDLVVAIMLAT